jgi:hypothetical protein
MSIVAGGEDSLEWFQRFGDVPGIDYPVPAGVEPKKLKGYGLKPEIHRSEAMPPSLWWDSLDDGDGSTSASPAHQRASTDLGEESVEFVLRNLVEALELPGIVTDYHFAIQSACGRLWLHRLENPQHLTELERWCRLDLALLKAKPHEFQYEHGGELSYYSIGAFSYLRSIYEKEGALLEALEVAEEESRFNPNEKHLEELRERVRAEAED